jgi:serine protease AprX
MKSRPTFLRTPRSGLVVGMACAAVLASGSGASAAPEHQGPSAAGQGSGTHGDSLVTSGFSGGRWGDSRTDAISKDAYGNNAARRDPGSMFTVGKAIGVRDTWKRRDGAGRPVTGQGVGVALLDSGVAEVPGLDAAGKVTHGPDLSIEGNGALVDLDTFGHGTFMAGIIAGRGASNPSSDLPSAPPSVQLGVAPDAKLLSLKLATTDGSTDVSQVIAALDWVTQHPVLPDGTRVRVINLSYGTDSAQGYQIDPLAAAAENAWKHGIVVVTSAGNSGTHTGRLTDPAVDPYVLAVGAADSSGSVDGWAPNHTKAASFSNVSAGRHADLIAPGTSLVSLRAPGSFVDTNNPQGLVSGDDSGNLFRGSGTSQASAVVSGAIANLLQAFPSLTPDQVKYALTASADPVRDGDVDAVGAGMIDLDEAFDLAGHIVKANARGATLKAAAVQSFAAANGQGRLDAARGSELPLDADGTEISGEFDIQGIPWNAPAWWQASTSLTAWSGGQWMGTTWTGDDWADDAGLSSARWSSARWSSARWSSADWSSARWSSARWSSARWSSARWSSARWSDADWDSARWSSARWSSARWSSARWSSARWSSDSW